MISLYGAWRLLLRDPRGIEWLDDSIEGYWKSFFCAIVVLPGYGLWFFFTVYDVNFDAGLFRILLVEGIGYIIGWVAWPLVMASVAPAIKRDHNYIRYIVAYNWASVWQNLVYLPFVILSELGYLSAGAGRAMGMLVLIMVMLYTWFITKTALRITGVLATGLVVLDFVVSIILNALTEGMVR